SWPSGPPNPARRIASYATGVSTYGAPLCVAAEPKGTELWVSAVVTPPSSHLCRNARAESPRHPSFHRASYPRRMLYGLPAASTVRGRNPRTTYGSYRSAWREPHSNRGGAAPRPHRYPRLRVLARPHEGRRGLRIAQRRAIRRRARVHDVHRPHRSRGARG